MNPRSVQTPTHSATQFRQGDVLVERVTAFHPMYSLKPVGNRIVLAEGEATGHAHVVFTKDCLARTDVREILMELKEPGELHHQEHSTIFLAPGTYRVTRQREYQPAPVSHLSPPGSWAHGNQQGWGSHFVAD